MAEVFVSFKADNPVDLRKLVEAFLWEVFVEPHAERVARGVVEAPSDPALEADAATLTDEEYDAKHPGPNGGEEPAAPTPTPTKRAARAPRAPRAPRVSAPPTALPASPDPTPAVDLPPLDALKSMVTVAVRLAQKGEGSTKILDLLPKFKDTTGLTFVMNAEDKHRDALYALIQAAGLPVV